MVVAGNVTTEIVKALAEKWFGNIPAGAIPDRKLPVEEAQTDPRKMEVHANVPLDAFYKCWHIADRLNDDYYAADLITDILGGGESSRLFEKLVKELQLFVNIQCYHMGSIDPGIICIEGKLTKGTDMKLAEAAIEQLLATLKEVPVSETELHKVKNKTESMMAFEDMSLLNRANSLAFYELLGDAGMMNTELQRYGAVTAENIRDAAQRIFREENSSTLYYYARN